MQHHRNSLDDVAFEFFQEFARCEYCLKVVGLLETNRRDPTADWGAFAAEIRPTLEAPSEELRPAVTYYLTHPPKKQSLQESQLIWASSTPDHKNQAELILRLAGC